MRLPLLLACLSVALVARADDPPFEIHDGDRVLLIGDTLLERENTYGYLETRMHEQFPTKRFSVRNLAFSADTPLGISRASFDPPAKGFERLKEQLPLVRPTVAIIGYGMAASLQEMTDRSGDPTLNPDPARYGYEPMTAQRFKAELGQLMDAIGESARAGVPGGALDPSAASGGSPDAKKAAASGSSGASDVSGESPATALGSSAPPGVRFVLLSPIRHEDLRAIRPGTPDPAAHNKLLEQYSKAIEELAKERGAISLLIADCRLLTGGEPQPATDNGIHLSDRGYRNWTRLVVEKLGWKIPAPESAISNQQSAISAAVRRKNDLFFHRWRPANETYLFGFRKHEQGRNAAEIPQFDPLVEAADAEIDRLKRSAAVPQRSGDIPVAVPPDRDRNVAATLPAAPPPPAPTSHLPDFQIAEGYQIELWAENPLLEKPTQMNWDPQGRLWVCSSAMYPQIAPGEAPSDKVLILEDTDRDGKADKSTVFADGLLIPTGVEPDFGKESGIRGQESGKTPPANSGLTPDSRLLTPSAAYVGQSTELLRLEDTDGDGKADSKRVVFSGFGTEDTHHIIHTLHWGPDGRLYFNQSVYIHSHVETPWGVVRLNSGGVLAYDPRTERLEVFAKGLWNPWGHQMDQWGQSFLTDGAGSTGISWAFPGATFQPFEGGRRFSPGISPGSYPKFCGLELVYSPHFPADWQGNAITCDFRAHRIVRFAMEDLAHSSHSSSSSHGTDRKDGTNAGYLAKEQPDFIRTADIAFRPIDVKLGPDGALYIADWSNPVINHGEVDFRDPRRDKHRGRIWRVTRKGAAPLKWEPLAGKKNEELLEKLLSPSLWEKEQARRVYGLRIEQAFRPIQTLSGANPEAAKAATAEFEAFSSEGEKWFMRNQTALAWLESIWLSAGVFEILHSLPHPQHPAGRAAAARAAGQYLGLFPQPTAQTVAHLPEGTRKSALEALKERHGKMRDYIEKALPNSDPRVRLEAIRALGRIPTARSAELILDAVVPAGERGAHAPSRAESGASPDSSKATGGAADTKKNGAARAGDESSAGAPKTAREARALPSSTAHPGVSVKDDPFLDYAAWLSINDLAQPWTDAILSGAWKVDSQRREQQLAYGLGAIDPVIAGKAVSAIFKDREIPRDGSGPWIDILGKAGGPDELRRLFDLVAKDAFDPKATVRVLHALREAARLRNARPSPHDGKDADPGDDVKTIAALLSAPAADLRAAAAQLAGYWKLEPLAERLAELAAGPDPGVSGAAFVGLREIGGQTALSFLGDLVRAGRPLDLRRAALASIAQVKLDAAVFQAPDVFAAITDENEAVQTWRALLQVKGAVDAFAIKIKQAGEKAVPKLVAHAGIRAAREQGKKGTALVEALAPIVGLTDTAPALAAQDIAKAIASGRAGDPAKGELVYRRANLACVTCHAIGGAGGKLGPDMTSLGASAPLDYIIESVVNPAAKVKEGYNAVTFTLKDNTQISGVQSRETAQEIFVRNAAGQEQSVPKAQIAGKTDVGSIMPAGLTDQLTQSERVDLFAFLGELGKPGPFDASKGRVALVWQLFPSAEGEKVMRGETKPDFAPVAYAFVDGRLPREQLAEGLQLVPNAGDSVIAMTPFQASGKAGLKLTGVAEAWIDGKPFVVAGVSDPGHSLAAGIHVLAVKLDTKKLPDVLRAEVAEGRFVGY